MNSTNPRSRHMILNVALRRTGRGHDGIREAPQNVTGVNVDDGPLNCSQSEAVSPRSSRTALSGRRRRRWSLATGAAVKRGSVAVPWTEFMARTAWTQSRHVVFAEPNRVLLKLGVIRLATSPGPRSGSVLPADSGAIKSVAPPDAFSLTL